MNETVKLDDMRPASVRWITPPSRLAASAFSWSISAPPRATDYWSMRRYLKEFLSDKRVIETSRLLWWPVLNLIILTKRPGPQGARLCVDLEQRARRGAAEDHHARAGRGSRGASESHCGRQGDGRLGDALRQAGDARAHPGPARSRVRPHPAGAALSAICRRDLRDRVRPRLSGADGHALAAGFAGLAALS